MIDILPIRTSGKPCGHKSPFSNLRCELAAGHPPGQHASARSGIWYWGDDGSSMGGGLKAMEIGYGKDRVKEIREGIRA